MGQHQAPQGPTGCPAIEDLEQVLAVIIMAAKSGGGDPAMNITLRYAIDKAKVLKLIEQFEDHDEAQKVHANFDIADAEMALMQ